jgi:hypothetical protein
MQLARVLGIGLTIAALLAAPHADARTRHWSSDYYTNSSGHRVHRPEYARRPPPGWTAQCRDGSYSFSEHHSGTCSHHGGVARWR